MPLKSLLDDFLKLSRRLGKDIAKTFLTLSSKPVFLPAESRLKDYLSAIAVYTQVVTVELKAERRGEKSTCIGR
jgi:hypothetical protein